MKFRCVNMSLEFTLIPHATSGSFVGRVTDVCHNSERGGVDAVRFESKSGDSGWVLFDGTAPEREYEWEVGAWYRLDGVVGCDPDRATRSRTERVRSVLSSLRGIDLVVDESDLETCPVCGGTIDAEPALNLDESMLDRLAGFSGTLYGLGREAITIELLGSGTVDWIPQQEQTKRRQPPEEPGPAVCLDCGRDISAHYNEEIAAERERQAAPEGGGAVDASQGPVAVSESAEQMMDASQGAVAASPSPEVGMATGGGKDANNFRDNVQNGYVPQPDSLTYEGLFYDYTFDTGDATSGDGLFYPSYATAVTESPLDGTKEQYLTVGLNSTLTEADLERKPLNLVAVVDVSGSMSSSFDQYYYDEHGNRREVTSSGAAQTKMAAARRALSALTEQLRNEDRFGVVLYNSNAHVAKPLGRVADTSMAVIREHIGSIQSGGGTNMNAGYSAAMDLLEPHHGADLTEVENRIVFMTDAMPNVGPTGESDIVDAFDKAVDEHVHTTFVGIGLDTNADLVESISGVKGANHYFIHSTEEFVDRLADEFVYMVTPLVFDLSLDVVSDGYEIETVYGSPSADEATGEVMHVRTLFPSPTTDGETRGGVTLLQLDETDPTADIELVATWLERDGTEHRDAATASLSTGSPEQFDNTGIRKAVLLSRYGRLLREWMAAVRTEDTDLATADSSDWISHDVDLGEWEESSVALTVPKSYRTEFDTLRQHLTAELDAIGDDTLSQEVEILDILSDRTAIEQTTASGSDGHE
jgi:Ca-activated chloride channel family protein